jgi:hypothetical protein
MALQLRSLVRASGVLELSLHDDPIPEPQANEVVVRVEASPMNPSDLGLLFGAADMSTAKVSGTPESPGRHRRHPRTRHAVDGGAARPVDAGRQRRRGRGGQGRLVAGRAGTAGQDGGRHRRRDVLAVPLPRRCAVPGTACRWRDPGRWRLLFRQPAHLAEHGRDHADGRPQGAGAHGGGLQPGPDAQQDLPEGRHRPSQHRAQARAGGAAARHRREVRVQRQLAHFSRRPDAGAGRHRRHARLRRHRRRQARRARSSAAWKRR